MKNGKSLHVHYEARDGALTLYFSLLKSIKSFLNIKEYTCVHTINYKKK